MMNSDAHIRREIIILVLCPELKIRGRSAELESAPAASVGDGEGGDELPELLCHQFALLP